MSKKANFPIFYVYQHKKLDSEEVFYVGKGHGKRAFSSSKRNIYWQRTAKKHGFSVHFVECNMLEKNAFDLEIALIDFYKSSGVGLCNLTDGGEGIVGFIPSDDDLKNIKIGRDVYLASLTKEERFKKTKHLQDPEIRKKNAKSIIDAYKDPAKRQNQIDALKKAFSNEELKYRFANILKEKQKDPAFKENQFAKIKQALNRPENIEENKKKTKDFWSEKKKWAEIHGYIGSMNKITLKMMKKKD